MLGWIFPFVCIPKTIFTALSKPSRFMRLDLDEEDLFLERAMLVLVGLNDKRAGVTSPTGSYRHDHVVPSTSR